MGCMPPDAKFDSFVRSLDDAAPPAGYAGPLLGVWHALRGDWEQAHDAVQDDTDDCSWVHAALHREEGDHGNAGYWYRRASRPVPGGDVREEYLGIASELLSR